MNIYILKYILLLSSVQHGANCQNELKVKRENSETFCQNRRDGSIYPDAEDCRVYVSCSGGYAYRSQCSPGLYYEPSLQACEFDTGQCVGRNDVEVVKAYIESADDKNLLRKHEGTEDEEKLQTGGFCDTRDDGTYVDPESCNGYILCSNSLAFPSTCPDSLVFSSLTNGCEYDVQGLCSSSPDEAEDPLVTYSRESPDAHLSLPPGLAQELATSMPEAVESAMRALTLHLQHEASLAQTMQGGEIRPFKLVQRFLKAEPLSKQLSLTSFVIHNASSIIVDKLKMRQPGSQEVLKNVPSPLPASNSRLEADDPFPEPQPGTCPWPLYDCKMHHKYRSFDGSCNNLRSPLLGRAFTPFKRFLPPQYGDGKESLRKGKGGDTLASAREVSVAIATDADSPHHLYTLMGAMQWGQFLDHDLDLTAISTLATEPSGYGKLLDIKCGTDGCATELPECVPISVPVSDRIFGGKRTCLEFVRSEDVPTLDCTMAPREQVNQITSFIDASQIYGSSRQQSDYLRDNLSPGRGRMKMSVHPANSSLKHLPPTVDDQEECVDFDESSHCFKAGDSRVNEQLGLTVLHTLWLREHNRIEEELHAVNPHWSGETLFQHTRRIIGAMLQHITYSEFLPIILGPQYIKMFDLELLDSGYYKGYDESVDPRIANVFAAVAFRFGHSLLQPLMQRKGVGFHQYYTSLNLSAVLNRPDSIYDVNNGGVDSFVRGMCSQAIQTFDRHVTSQVTSHLFTEHPPIGEGMDLVALNIQRGRDHGIPGYNAWREWCGFSKARDFYDLTDIADKEVIEQFRTLYKHVDDIDLFPAGISERSVEGGIVGPTFACIIARQFESLRKGDRFWYENEGAFSFTADQLQEIRKATLSYVLCKNGDNIRQIQPHVMQLAFRHAFPTKRYGKDEREKLGMSEEWFRRLWDTDYNALTDCQCLPALNLTLWQDYHS